MRRSPAPIWIATAAVLAMPATAAARQLVTQRPIGGAKPHVAVEAKGLAEPAWSPDGKLIAYVARRPNGPGFELDAVPARGGKPRTIVGRVRDEQIAWSPSSHRIAFVDRSGAVVVANRNGRRIRHIATRVSGAESLVWSPNGRMLAFDAYVHRRCRGSSIVAVKASGGRPRVLTNPIDCRGRDFEDGYPVWADSGSTLLFARWYFKSTADDVSHGSELFTVGVGGGGERQLTFTNYRWQIEALARSRRGEIATARARVFPPDPRSGDQFTGSDHLWLARSASSRFRRRVRPTAADSLAWSPSGRRLALSGDGGMFVTGRSGRHLTRLATLALDPFETSWSPGGRRLAYTRDAPGR